MKCWFYTTEVVELYHQGVTMQGLWKEKLGGFNNKDIKRKKQKRKHTLRDKYVGLYFTNRRNDKKLNKDIYREDSKIIHTNIEENGMTINESCYIYLVKVTYRKDFRSWKPGYNEYEEKYLKVYSEFDGYYSKYEIVYNTGYSIVEYLKLYTEKMEEKYGHKTEYTIKSEFKLKVDYLKPINFIKWDLNNVRYKKKTIESTSENSIEFVFNKPINKQVIMKKYTRNVNNKYFKYMYNKQTRREVRDWINKGSWDEILIKKNVYYGYDYY